MLLQLITNEMVLSFIVAVMMSGIGDCPPPESKQDSLVVAYTNGQLHPSDDSVTYSLLNQLTISKTTEQKACYFRLFNEIVMSADGALAESMGKYCAKWLKADSPLVLDHLKRNPDLERRYVLFLSTEFYYEEDSFPSFKQNVLRQFETGSRGYPSEFLKRIESAIKAIDNE